MALCHFSSFSSTLQNLRCTFASDLRWKAHPNPVPKVETPHFRREAHQRTARINLAFTCSAEKSSIKKRASRPTKSNEELCNELREFTSTMGLPVDHVPSLKELLEHGRKDLANIVRRRGYKVITELLRDLSEKGTNIEKRLHGNQDIGDACKDEASEDRERNRNEYAECISLPSDSSLVESYMVRANSSTNTSTVQTYALDDENLKMSTGVDHSSDILKSDGAGTVSAASQHVSPFLMEQYPARDHAASGELNKANIDPSLPTEMARERDNQIEIDRLKAMLHQKEMELSQLKQQIEKEKQALSILQSKAHAQISNTSRIISAKDVELRAAEESLSGLKEVQIGYWANGETVEVSGSFNGWHHRIRMDTHPSSDTINPPDSRKSKLWSTVLWLYPGIYEIKFIVDGHWRVDSQREVATRGIITNNVLRVDR